MTPDCTIIVRSPAELLAVTPYVLGFHPSDSIVLIGMDGPEVTFGARYDLPPPEVNDPAGIATLVARQQVDSVTVIGYGPPARVTPAVLRVAAAITTAGVRVEDVLRVTGDRWWSYCCEDPRCCPEQGRPCSPPGNAIAAQAVFRGQVALPDRDALVAQVAAVTGAPREAMAAATARAESRMAVLFGTGPQAHRTGAEGRAGSRGRSADPPERGAEPPERGAEPPERGADPPDRGADAGDRRTGPARPAGSGPASVGRAADPDGRRTGRSVRRAGRAVLRDAERRHLAGRSLTDDQVAWLGLLLLHRAVRDDVWARSGSEQWRIRLWTDVLRRVEPAYVPVPACLLALTAWQSGNGALARVAIDRALAEHPGHPLVRMVDRLLCSGIGPHVVAARRPPPGRGGRVRPGLAGRERHLRRGSRRRAR